MWLGGPVLTGDVREALGNFPSVAICNRAGVLQNRPPPFLRQEGSDE